MLWALLIISHVPLLLHSLLIFLCIDAYDNSVPGCSCHAEFGNTFADFFMNQFEIIRPQFKQSSFYTLPSQNCANVTQCRPISDEKP